MAHILAGASFAGAWRRPRGWLDRPAAQCGVADHLRTSSGVGLTQPTARAAVEIASRVFAERADEVKYLDTTPLAGSPPES
jgi:hypothetical protein